MNSKKSLLHGIGNQKETRLYYDSWADNYDETLKTWNYRAPQKSVKILKKYTSIKSGLILDLACGTGLFGEEFLKVFDSFKIDGSDISSISLKIAHKKNIYRKLFKNNFEDKMYLKINYDIVSLIGAMTYCKKYKKLFNNVSKYLNKGGFFIFTQRTDLWDKLDFNQKLIDISKNYNLIYKSKPIDYLPKNNDFTKNIKIRIVLIQKK